VKADHRMRRTDLFLVRVWAQAGRNGTGTSERIGKVQRVFTGEAHQFSDWQGLVELLEKMAPEGIARSNGNPN